MDHMEQGHAEREIQEAKLNTNDCHNQRTYWYHKIWVKANNAITRSSLYSNSESVDEILSALQTARIVYVDTYDIGVSEKWVVTLEGGQKAMMKLDWKPSEFGHAKESGRCNDGFERPSSEIAAFHLHRVLGMNNSAYVSGRLIDIRNEIIPVASQDVLKQITLKENKVCITGHFYEPRHTFEEVCNTRGLIRASLSYWIPRSLKDFSVPPTFMPFWIENQDRYGSGFNNQTYCKFIRRNHKPYDKDWYFLDLFDFAVLDMLMNHFDSKHYIIHDKSSASGLTVKIDLGRSFCDHGESKDDLLLEPLKQCCILRKATYDRLLSFYIKKGSLSKQWKHSMSYDVLDPVMDDIWFSVIEKRLSKIINVINKCATEKGGLSDILV